MPTPAPDPAYSPPRTRSLVLLAFLAGLVAALVVERLAPEATPAARGFFALVQAAGE